MKVLHVPGKRLRWEHGLLGYLFSPGIKARTALFDGTRKMAVISKGVLRKTDLEIPFSRIRAVVYRIYAPIYFSAEVPPVRLESNWAEISLRLADSPREILYQENYTIDNDGNPGRAAIRRILGMTDDVAEITGKPVLLDWEEAEIFLDMGAAKILLTGDLIPPQIKGREIPFRKVEAFQAVRGRAYFAVRIVTRDGESFVTTQGYDTYTRLHDTTELIAMRAKLPFQKVEGSCSMEPPVGRRYVPIAPSMRGTVPGR